MERSIVHMDLDSFFVSCERLINPDLLNKPVIVGGTTDRGVVASCSYEARRFGVHSAMPTAKAIRLCPDAILVRGNGALYTKYSNLVTQIIHEMVPLYQKSSIDEFYIDLTGTDKYFGAYQLAKDLRNRIIKETNLPISFGFSTNKTVSKIATGEAKPNNQMKVDAGEEKAFLAPLVISKIPMLGKSMQDTLNKTGIFLIKDIQKLPRKHFEQFYGKHGAVVWDKANGIDNTVVETYRERKSISTERTFHQNVTDYEKLKDVVLGMTERLAFQLRKKQFLTSCVAIKIRYANFDTFSKQQAIDFTASDHLLRKTAKQILSKITDEQNPVRLIGVRLSGLKKEGYQLNLFDSSSKSDGLYDSIDVIKSKYGVNSISSVAAADHKMRAFFNPFSKE